MSLEDARKVADVAAQLRSNSFDLVETVARLRRAFPEFDWRLDPLGPVAVAVAEYETDADVIAA